ncbi:MAG: hypothetical protein WDW36_002079 [Sanguina aurantia]
MYVEQVVVMQPQQYMVPIFTAPWTTGLFACCDDLGICLCGCFCTPCLFGYNTNALTGRDCCGACCLYSFFTFCGCLCDGFCGDFMQDYVGARVRSQIRMKYGLMEDPCADFVTHMCCPHCALCQEARELKYRAAAGPAMMAMAQPQMYAPQQQQQFAPPQQMYGQQPQQQQYAPQQQQQYAPQQQQQYAPQQQQQQYPPQQQQQYAPQQQQQQQYAPQQQHQGQQYAPQQQQQQQPPITYTPQK